MRTRDVRARTGTSGFLLIELCFSITILATVVATFGWLQMRSQASYRATAARAEIEAKAAQAATRVVAELTGIGASTLVPDPTSSFGTTTLTFQTPTAVSNAGVITWSAPSRLELQDDEADDDVDNDSDGIVDEKRLVLLRNVGALDQQTIVLCRNVVELAPGETANAADDDGDGLVDEAGFNVQRTGDLLRVQLTVVRSAGDGTFVTGNVSTALVLHN